MSTLVLEYCFYKNFELTPTLTQQVEALEKLQQRIAIYSKDCTTKKIDKLNKRNRSVFEKYKPKSNERKRKRKETRKKRRIEGRKKYKQT